MKHAKYLFIAFSFLALTAISLIQINAQNNKSPKQIKILNNLGAIPFEDGKTIIAEIEFMGLDLVGVQTDEDDESLITETDVLRVMREGLAKIEMGEAFYGYKVAKAVKAIRGLLPSKGYDKAEVNAFGEKLPNNRMKLIFSIKRGELARISEIRFEGTKNITNEQLIADFKQCSGNSWKIFEPRRYQFYLRICSLRFMFSKGYFKARIGEPRREFLNGQPIVTVDVNEGVRFRYGEIKVTGATVFTSEKILEFGGIKEGEVANGKALQEFVYEKLKRIYADKGYVLYDADFDPTFIEPQADGLDAVVDLSIKIDEGKQFKLEKIEFIGLEKERVEELRKQFSLQEGETYNQSKIEEGFKKINELREFYPIDLDSSYVEILIKEPEKENENAIIAEKDGVVLRQRDNDSEIKIKKDSDYVNLTVKLRKIEQ